MVRGSEALQALFCSPVLVKSSCAAGLDCGPFLLPHPEAL